MQPGARPGRQEGVQTIRARRAPRLLAALAVAILAPALAVTAGTTPATATAPAPPASPAGPADPADDDRGTWRVESTGDGRYTVSWTAPADLPVRSDRPEIEGAGLVFGPSTTAVDGRTVTAVTSAPEEPRPADLDVVLSGDRLDEPGDDVVDATEADPDPDPAPGPRADPLPGPDPGAPGPHAVVTSDYELPAVKVPGMRLPIEMVGHVVEPAAGAATGPRPLVLLLHGRHDVCYDPDDPDAWPERWPCEAGFEEIPSHLGYDYVQRTLASQGYATVSVRVNGINAQDQSVTDGGAGARAAVVRRHLDHWVSIAGEHQVDLAQVVLVGHSRGGEGVDRAAIQIPATAPYRVVGQVLLAPTDFASHAAPHVPTVTVLPHCDGDVWDLQGQRYTDVARDLDPADPALRSSVLVMGANHNFFNTEWTPGSSAAPSFDDWGGAPTDTCGRRTPDRLTAAEQRRVGRAYVAAAVGLFTGRTPSTLPLFDGSGVTPSSVGGADVRSHAIGGGRDERRPGAEATPSLATGDAESQLCTGLRTADGRSWVPCGRLSEGQVTPHWPAVGEGVPARRFLRVTWSSAGAAGGLQLARPLDLRTRRLELRTIVDPKVGDVSVRVRLTDAAGGSAVLEPEGGPALPALPAVPGVTKLWAQPVLVDPAAATGVDLRRVTRVEVVGDSPRGQVFVAEVSAAPAVLPAVPTTRMPRLALGELRVVEGDGDRAVRTARVPFRVLGGPLTRPARFLALTATEGGDPLQRLVVDVAAGQTTGSVPVAYLADRTDDPDTTTTQVLAYPLRGLATDDHVGALRVVDDDPPPALVVRAPRTVREGGTAVFRVRLAPPPDGEFYVDGRVVRSPRASVRGDDVTRGWLAAHGDPSRRDLPLWRTSASVSADLSFGTPVAEVRVPIARDRRREGTELLTIAFTTLGRRQVVTVRVLDAS